MIAAFSRSSRPMRPMSLESVICTPGSALAKDFARLGFALRIDRAEHRGDRDRADALGPDVRGDAEKFGFVERRNLAAVEFMAAVSEIGVTADRAPKVVRPVDHRRQRGGRRQPRRTAAVGARSRRCTTALVKWVVPIMTTSIASGFRPDAASTDLSAATTPDITSGVVTALTPARTFAPSMTTASVLVPPTSTPILIMPCSPASTFRRSAPCRFGRVRRPWLKVWRFSESLSSRGQRWR